MSHRTMAEGGDEDRAKAHKFISDNIVHSGMQSGEVDDLLDMFVVLMDSGERYKYFEVFRERLKGMRPQVDANSRLHMLYAARTQPLVRSGSSSSDRSFSSEAGADCRSAGVYVGECVRPFGEMGPIKDFFDGLDSVPASSSPVSR
jgi:hypothetical protein